MICQYHRSINAVNLKYAPRTLVEPVEEVAMSGIARGADELELVDAVL